MKGGRLSVGEKKVIHDLLFQKGITQYEVVPEAPEGDRLPGSTASNEIESMSGYIVTSTAIYTFWLDWYDGHYTLSEEDGYWSEINPEDLGSDKHVLLEIQQNI